MAKDVFLIEAPAKSSKGKYLLIVQQGQGVFGSSQSVFIVDGIKFVAQANKVVGVQGMLGTKMVVTFSPESTYILIDKTLTRTSTSIDLAIEDRKEDAELKKRMEEEFPVSAVPAVELLPDGRVKTNTQGYL